MSQVKPEPIDDGSDDDEIRSNEGCEWTLETSSLCTTEDENAQGNESTSMNALLEAKAQLEKLKEVERPIIQAIREKMDESAKEMATRNAEHQKQIAELEIGKKLALEKYQKQIAELEAKNWERNAKFAKEMANLKKQMNEINWNLGKKQPRAVVSFKQQLVNPITNPKGNSWDLAQIENGISISVSVNGLKVTINNNRDYQSVSAEKGFIISADFSGPVIFYFEVTIMSTSYKMEVVVGLSGGNIPDDSWVGDSPNSYGIEDGYDYCWLSGKEHNFEWPNGATKPEWKGKGDVYGCGLLLNPENELSIFFTGNGILMGKQIPIKTTVELLYPTISMYGKGNVAVQANFGDNSAKPFKYDIDKCPGMVFE